MRDTSPIAKFLDQNGDTEAAAARISVARTVLGQLVNQMDLGGLKVGTRTLVMEDGTAIRAVVAGGIKRIYISVPATTPTAEEATVFTPTTPETPEFTPPTAENYKCLLVIFNNNEIAAIPMKAITGSRWEPIYRGRIHTSVSSWQPVAQFNFGVPGCDSIFLGPFSLQDNVFTLDTQNHWLSAVKENDGSEPHAFHSVRTQAAIGDPLISATGATVYAPDGTYEVIQGIPQAQQSYVSAFGSAYPRGIAADGTYYFAGNAVRHAEIGNAPSIPPQYVGPGAAIAMGGGGLAANAAAITQFRSNTAANAISEYYQAGAAGFTGARAIAFANDPGGSVDYSLAFPLVCYQNGNSRDRLATAALLPNLQNGVYDEGLTIIDESSQSVLGWTEILSWSQTEHDPLGSPTYTFTMTENGMNSVTVNGFPPALSASRVYAFANDNSATVTQTQTPYFASDDQGCYGWAHLSNGAHMLQAFFTYNNDPVDTPHLYVDGVDVRAKLEAALGTALLNVQVMLMDIPLATIQRIH